MNTLYELIKELFEVSSQISSTWIPIKVDGKEIESVILTDKLEVEIKTKKPNFMDFYKGKSLGENIEIKDETEEE